MSGVGTQSFYCHQWVREYLSTFMTNIPEGKGGFVDVHLLLSRVKESHVIQSSETVFPSTAFGTDPTCTKVNVKLKTLN